MWIADENTPKFHDITLNPGETCLIIMYPSKFYSWRLHLKSQDTFIDTILREENILVQPKKLKFLERKL